MANFQATTSIFNGWCKPLLKYAQIVENYKCLPDLFSTMSHLPGTSELVVRVSQLGERKIPAAQHDLILGQIEFLKQYIISQGTVNDNNFAQLQAGMTYLIEASDRLGSKDFLNLLMATVMGFILSSPFDPTRGEELIQYAFGLFQFLFGPQLLSQ